MSVAAVEADARTLANTPTVERTRRVRKAETLALGATVAAGTVWAIGFGWLSVVRHLAGGSHAEDLGFTDQVVWNFLRGQWFRMSIYNGATWNTEVDISRIARPDSLLAFHVEPMLLLFVPLYIVGGGAATLLVIQSAAVASGAIPAYRLGRHFSQSPVGGVAVAMAYLLSPLGQWAVLSDFHTATLAAPLLMLSVERLVVGDKPVQALLAAGLAVTAREDVAPALAVLGLVLLVRRRAKTWGMGFVALGLGWGILAALAIRSHSGDISPFQVRYGPTLGAGLAASLDALTRPLVLSYAWTVLQSGGWLGLIAPLALLPAVPGVALNALSTSPWMAAGKAHYSSLVLPFVVVSAAAALGVIARRSPRLTRMASAALVVTSVVGYINQGAGPLGGNYAPAYPTEHSALIDSMAHGLPANAAVSASASLVPHVSQRARVYVFPAVNDADYVFLDLKSSPAPTSAGDVYVRVHDLLLNQGWGVQTYQPASGLLVLERDTASSPPLIAASVPSSNASAVRPLTEATLLDARLVPSPDGSIDVDGPQWTLRTTWQASQPLPRGTQLAFDIQLSSGERVRRWDVADLWWNPPETWTPDQPVTIDVPEIPVREFKSWEAEWTTPES